MLMPSLETRGKTRELVHSTDTSMHKIVVEAEVQHTNGEREGRLGKSVQ
jgi:hypothetical protein